MVDAISLAYLAAAAAMAVLAFRDAPQKLLAAHREDRVTERWVYHAVNAASVLVILAWILGLYLAWDAPLIAGTILSTGARILGLALALAGFAIGAWARVALGRAFAPTAATPPEDQIIRRGPYRHVRHPFYVGLMLALAGGALVLDSRLTAVVTLAMVPLVRAIAVLEEQHLVQTVGRAYERYMARVPRWVPWP